MKNPDWILLNSLAVTTQGFAGSPASVDAGGLVTFNGIDTDRSG